MNDAGAAGPQGGLAVRRSRLIWTQSTAARRRGYFLAGVGLTTGHALDAIATEANIFSFRPMGHSSTADTEAAIAAITGLAERVFAFYPFTPDPLPANWRDILRAWLLGAAARRDRRRSGVGDATVHRGWPRLSPSLGDGGVRVRAVANGDTIGRSEWRSMITSLAWQSPPSKPER